MFIPHVHIKSKHDRVLVVGDIHGNLKALMKLLKKAKYDPQKDLLVSLGDLIDRGDHSLATLTYFLDNPNILVVAGNHEDIMVRSFFDETSKSGNKALWHGNGGTWGDDVDKSLLKTIAKKMVNQFAYTATVELQCGTKFGFTHGDVVGTKWLGENYHNQSVKELTRLMWGRDRAKHKYRANYVIEDVDFTIHGHTPSELPHQFRNSIFIDTGAAYKEGMLTGLILQKFLENNSLAKSCVYAVCK